MDKKIEKEILERSGGNCEICSSSENTKVQHIENMPEGNSDSGINICSKCEKGLSSSETIAGNEWRVLSESIWSEVPAVKVASWRILNKIDEPWAKEALEMAYLEDELLDIAKSTQEIATHFDSNGIPLQKGDSVTLIKDLDVKGSNLIAKRGTVVKNISLSQEDDNHVLGKVEGQSIYIKTEFVKRLNA